MVSVVYAVCRKQTQYDECQSAECRMAERRYAECRGAQGTILVEHLTRCHSVTDKYKPDLKKATMNPQLYNRLAWKGLPRYPI
jgi:hypothetical protein